MEPLAWPAGATWQSSLNGLPWRRGAPLMACPGAASLSTADLGAGVALDYGSQQGRGLLSSVHGCSDEKNTSKDDMWDPHVILC
jgi:hypothetical protein